MQTTKNNAGGKAGGAAFTDISYCLDEFHGFIQAEYGLDLTGALRADGEFHGIATTEDKHGKPFRYCVYLDEPQNIYFTDLKRGVSGTWFPEGRAPLNPAGREQRRREFEARQAQRKRETAERHAKAAQRAQTIWRKAGPADPSHPYLARKGVGVYGVRYMPTWERRVYQDNGEFETVKIEGALLVPMKDASGALWNLQAIFPTVCPELGRDKDFLSGARKQGLFHWLGKRTETVCLAEGYATGASIHEETGYRVFICFDAGNLPFVAEAIRGRLPNVRIVVCADHDLPDKNGRRAGQEKAEEAAALVGGFVALPPVEGGDFNDWAIDLKGKGYGG
jgi:putative DNA primase/helicase